MAKQFLTGLNLNKNELLNARIQNLASAPSSPVAGQIYYNTGDNTLRYWNGTSWLTLAQGGDLAGAIQAAIDLLDTDDIEEGSNNLYFTNERAQDAVANAIAAGTHSNITITYDDSTNKFTFAAENGVADSTTDNLSEGSTNKYFTDERAQDAVGNAVGNTLSYNDTTGAISLNRVTVDTFYDAAGSASTVQSNLDDHASDTTTHGVTGSIVGTSDTQTLSNKTLTSTTLGDDLDADGYTITNVATPVSSGDAANKAYVDSTAQGLDIKASVHAATITAGTLATSFEAGDSIDGHTLSAGDRILIKNQTDSKENGIYVVNASGAPTRAADADSDAELTKGSFVFVENGSQASTGWVLSTLTGSLDATGSSRAFTQFSGAGLITAGAGLTKTGNQLDVVGTSDRITVNSDSIDIASTYVGQTSITTLGTVTTGFWEAGTIDVERGGTGATSSAAARANLGATTKYAESNGALTVSSGSVSWTITHSLGTSDVTVQMRDVSTKALVEADVVITDANTVTISWVSASNVSSNTYRAVVVG